MNRIALIAMYFGQLPGYIHVALDTLSRNKTIDLLFFTDQQYFAVHPNIRYKWISYEALRARIQASFPFRISLDNPYKLCDFRPAFGVIFEEELFGYEYWGHCDLDVVFGDIWRIIREPVEKGICKIFQNGHLTFYKNETSVNHLFKDGSIQKHGLSYDYRTVFSCPRSFAFDERNGIQELFDRHGMETYRKISFADISAKTYPFRLYIKENDMEFLFDTHDYRGQQFFWRDGHVFRCWFDAEIKEEEFLYLHFQKRNLRLRGTWDEESDEILLLHPEGFFPMRKSALECEDLIALSGIEPMKTASMYCRHWGRELKRKWMHIADKVIKPF